MSNNGPLTPTFAPFKSGCGVCKPSTDYYQQPQAGGIGNYSNDGLIPASNGKNFYKAQDFDVSDSNIMKNNYNKEFFTSFGGKKPVSKKSKPTKSTKSTKTNLKKKIVKKSSTVLKKKKKVMKGGTYAPYGASDNIEGPNTNSDVQSSNTQGNTVPGTFASTMFEPATFMSGGKSKKNNHKGGFSSIPSEEHHEIMSGGKSKKNNHVGGFSSIPSEEHHDMMNANMNKHMMNADMNKDMMNADMNKHMMNANMNKHMMNANMNKHMMNADMNKHMSGGKSKKNNHVGGFSSIPSEEHNDIMDNMTGGKKSKTTKKSKSTKKSKKMMNGGMETSGATPMNQRFYDVNANLDNYPANSGNGIMSAYGQIVSGDIGSGMLAPYTASTCSMANHNTDMKTGGSKTKNNKKQKGGMETMGATPLPQRFFNPDIKSTDYPMDSGKGAMSAYGAVEPNDIGSEMLAPYTTSNSPTANYNTDMKTGGSMNKKNKKNFKGGDGPIPSISSQPISNIQNTLTGAINNFSNFMQTLDQDYLNSVAQIQSVKIGSQRLIQGGKSSDKKKTMMKSSMKKPMMKSSMKKPMMKSSDKNKPMMKSSMKKPMMKSSDKKKPMMKSSDKKKPMMKSSMMKPMMKSSDKKKPMMKSSDKKKPMMKSSDKKKSMKKSMKGGDGSDFASTLNSRGPCNYPDSTWGVSGEKMFYQFNKTGQYIPNSQLAYAATPLLLSETNDSDVVSGYNEMDLSYQYV